MADPLAGLELDLARALRPRGTVDSVADGVARVSGLPTVGFEELLELDSGALGMAYDLSPDHLGVVLLSHASRARAGDGVRALGRLPSLPVGDALLGRVIDPLGRPLDDLPDPLGQHLPVFRRAPELFERAPVDRPLSTGVMVIDTAIPIGRGQRQLIVGDRNVGKSALALDIVAAQRDVVSVYVAVGQPISRVLAMRELLAGVGALPRTIVVAADAASAPGMQYLAPYAGASISEHFRDTGRDALVVYDDLTKHADAYRELALLLDRPPGREAFPGDIFNVHAELLERATPLSAALGGGSVTAFPIIETTESDISAYIPTNLISITDGQIYLDSARFERNVRPAVDVGRSVSRIGGVAQPPALRAAARNVRIQVARFEGLEALTRVGLDIDPVTKKAVERGRILRELLRQPRLQPRSVAHQILAVTAMDGGWLDGLSPADAAAVVVAALARARASDARALADLDGGQDALDEGRRAILAEAVQVARRARE